jgi:tetratricopeptide (TPR) repeat protein
VAPYNYELVWEALCQKYGEPIPRPPAVAAIRELDAIWQYDLEAMHALMLMLDQHPDDFLPIAERACDVEAGQCERLADYLFDLGREADAARAYERMIAGARDRVGVSNSVDWLVRYYHDTGQRERAMEIAKMAAEVYSAGGLTALADELDRLGKREHAEEVYKTIASRYGSDISLLTFYLREARRAGTPLDNARTHELIREHFGVRGMMPMSSAPNEPPADGVHVASLGLSARRLGLALEDVVVALDGWRVHNTDQYEIVKWITETDDMHLLVWRDGKYVEVRAKVPRRTWQVRILDYVPPAPATR